MLEIPSLFLNSISECCGFENDAFVKAHQNEPPTSIRINPLKPTPLNFDLTHPVLWNKHGFYLNERPNFTHDIFFQAGCYYVQEAASMFIEHALLSCVDFSKQLIALDSCAAPGGKSTLLNSLLNSESVLVANEISKPRVEVLSQNLVKWGTHNLVVTNNDPSAFNVIENTFDIILVDAPCSGSGLFRKQHDAVEEWSIDHVNLCAQRQKRILADLVGSLSNNGVLLYSTCSYSEQENENIADWLIEEFNLESIQIPIKKDWGIVETKTNAFGYRFYPDKTESEGFFCSLFIKKSDDKKNRFTKKNRNELFSDIKPKEKETLSMWVDKIDEHAVIKFKNDYLLTNQLTIDFISNYNHLYLKKVGTTIGSLIKNELIPNHDLALSIHKNKSIKVYEINKAEAIRFLKKENLKIDCDQGWILVRYKSLGLGWIKQLGNRFNNYLPNEFRIMK
ncbi:MAG: methyltransferase RsmF C-terminal domain-like protein [Bacteroidota bacterium]|jgi:16S rRNA C967 or C1407 C5-methylase (RsmB/RsmF family)/NOL1/NOP2/fmu family ribosome biogenesis protein